MEISTLSKYFNMYRCEIVILFLGTKGLRQVRGYCGRFSLMLPVYIHLSYLLRIVSHNLYYYGRHSVQCVHVWVYLYGNIGKIC